MEKIPISVIIIAGQEENNIEDCLKSVLWSDDIVVVNSCSKDKTVEIAKKYTDRVFLKEWEGYAKQKAYSLSLAKNKWTLSLDADERVTDELKNELVELIRSDKTLDGYSVPRRNYFLGKWIKSCGWYPGYQLRFFIKDKTSLTDRKVHEGFVVDGKTGYLKGDLIHYTHPNIEYIISKINEYSSLQAEEKCIRKKARWFNIIINPIIAFLQHFILRKGFTDGIHGFLVSLIHALTNLLTYIKIWEIQNVKKIHQ
jgi:glycosyltransferase involved in cell wall biosynthesis